MNFQPRVVMLLGVVPKSVPLLVFRVVTALLRSMHLPRLAMDVLWHFPYLEWEPLHI